MKESTRTVNLMEEECIFGKTNQHTRAALKMVSNMASAFGSNLVLLPMKASSIKT